MNNSLRLNKFLAERLGISRREADEAIKAGKVTINGRLATIGERITIPNNLEKTNLVSSSRQSNNNNPTRGNVDKYTKVCYNGKTVPFEAAFLYLAFHKPIGYVCSRHAQGPAPTIYDLLPKKYHHLKTVGRLDKDSSGLILLTNDGDFAYKMTHPKFRKNKVYEVELDRPLEPLHQQMITDYGIALDDGPSRFKIIRDTSTGDAAGGTPIRVPTRMGETAAAGPVERYIVILSEGRNRQIRRTFAALGYKVTKLHRTEFGPFKLNNLPVGKACVIIKP